MFVFAREYALAHNMRAHNLFIFDRDKEGQIFDVQTKLNSSVISPAVVALGAAKEELH